VVEGISRLKVERACHVLLHVRVAEDLHTILINQLTSE
jgi:hypothetical protein